MNAKSMNTASATAKIEGSKEARPPGGFPLASAPKKIFICLPYRSTANDAPCRRHSWKQTSRGQRQPAGFLPRWESCRWLRICILPSS